MDIFRCGSRHISYAMDAIRFVKQNQEQNFIDPVNRDTLYSYLSNPHNYLIVAVVSNVVTGFIVAYELQRADRPASMMLLYEIGVLSHYRGRASAPP